MSYVGVDLAASPRRTTGLASISSGLAETASALYDEELMAWIISKLPTVVAIDSPLSLPSHGAFRDVDKALISMGYRVLPPAWRHMRELTARAMELSRRLTMAGAGVIETHPRSALRASGCESPVALAKRLGLRLVGRPANRHEEDALVAASVAYALRKGLTVEVRGSEGSVYLLKRLCS